MLATACKDVRWIATAATTWRNPQGVKLGGRMTLFAMLALGLAALAGLLPWPLFWRGELMIAVAWFALLWMTLYLPATVLMNSAPNARLVPRLRRRLLQMGAAGWLLVTLGATLTFGSWRVFPLFAAYMLGVMLQRAGMRSAATLVVFTAMWPLLSEQLPAPLVQAATGTASLFSLSVLLVLATAWALARLYPAGGDRHLDGREQVVTGIRRFESADKQPTPSWAWIDRLAYGPALRHACLRGKPGTLLLHALGPSVHWTAWIPGLGIIVLFILVLSAFLTSGGISAPHDMARGVLGTTLIVLNTLVILGSAKFSQALRTTQGEQALLRLTPLAGQAALLNRRLADAMMKSALFDWAMMTAVLLTAGWLFGADATMLLRQFALSCVAALLALTGLLGDFARALPSLSWRQLLAVVMLAGGGAALQRLALGSLFWVGLALASLAGAALVLRAAHRRMLAAPPAFPAERMG